MANGRRRSNRATRETRKGDNPLPSTAAAAVNINRRVNRRLPVDRLKIPATRNSNHNPPQQQAHHPWLLFCHDHDFKRQTFFRIDGRIQHHRRSIPELRNKRVEGCGYGWLLLLDYYWDSEENHVYSLWNISTFETILLPPVKLTPNFTVQLCFLTSSPGTSGAMICLTESDSPRIIFLSLCGRRRRWNEIGFQKQLQNLGFWETYASDGGKCAFYGVACCNGAIYLETNHSDLFKLCINEDKKDPNKLLLKPLNIKLEMGEFHSINVYSYLVSSGEELFSISINSSGVSFKEVIAIEVLRLNFDLMEWERVVNTKDRTFFVAGSGSFACPASCEEEGGRIYFTIYGDKNIYFYDIERKRLSVAFCCPKLPSPRSPPIWVMPINNRLTDDAKLMKKGEAQKEGEIVWPLVNTPRDTDVAKEPNLLHLVTYQKTL